MSLEEKPFMKDVKYIVLEEDTVCKACSDHHLKRGQKVIKYHNNKNKDLNGIYCFPGCLEGHIDCVLESGSYEEIREFYLNEDDPVAKKVFKELGLKWN